MMNSRNVTALVLTYNEEPNIRRVLERLDWVGRIVVVDSFSTDRTTQIAGEFTNAEVVQRSFDNHVAQWNFGLSNVTSEWVLTLDADYVLTEDAAAEMQAVVATPAFDGYYAGFRYCVFGKPLRATLYPPRLVLFRVSAGEYVADGHTQRLSFRGTTGTLIAPLLHDDRKSLAAWLQAQDRYANLEVEKLANASPTTLSRNDAIRRRKWVAPLLVLPYCLFVKGLILDGSAGWYYSLQRTYAELLLSLKLIEHAVSKPTHRTRE